LQVDGLLFLVDGESVGRIVHHAVEIVRQSKVIGVVISVEVVLIFYAKMGDYSSS